MLTLTASISNKIHIAFVISFCARAVGSGSHCLVLITVEALRVLLSSSVSSFLAKKAAIFSSVSSVVMWAPEFVVRRVLSRFIGALAFRLMKTIKVKGYHDIFSILVYCVIFSILILNFCSIVICSIDQKLLRCALRLLNDICNKDWSI